MVSAQRPVVLLLLPGHDSSPTASPLVGPALPRGLPASGARFLPTSPFCKETSGTKTQQMAHLKVQTLELSGSREATKTLLMHLLC